MQPTFKPLGPREIGLGHWIRYHSGDPDHPPAAGLKRLKQAAGDTTPYLVRVENGLITRVMREAGPLHLKSLLVNRSGTAATAYACSFRINRKTFTLIVARGRLLIPAVHAIDERSTP